MDKQPNIDAMTTVHPTAKIASSAIIGAYAHIGSGAVIVDSCIAERSGDTTTYECTCGATRTVRSETVEHTSPWTTP